MKDGINDRELQIPRWEFESMLCDYEDWHDSQYRACRAGFRGNSISVERQREIIRLMYSGLHFQAIHKRIRIGNNPLLAVIRKVMEFISLHPVRPLPKCACGRDYSHKGTCHVKNPGMMERALKGLESQRRTRLQNDSTIFFETLHQTQAMTTAMTTPTIESNAARFASLVQQGIDAWTEAGKLLIQMIEANPNAKQAIIDHNPDLTEEILSRFEAIGRNQLHPKTLLNNSPGMRRLRALPFSDQERYLSSPVPVLIQKGDGVDTLQVDVRNLTAKQAQQVFAGGYVRAPEAQRAYLESKRITRRRSGPNYTIKSGKVLFLQDCELTAREIADIMAKLAS